jgi:hypothetical protein
MASIAEAMNLGKNAGIDLKVFISGISWTAYSVYYCYLITINYMVCSIQVAILYTSVLYLDKRNYKPIE